MSTLFTTLNHVNDFMWENIATPLIILIGIYLTFYLNLIQIKKFPTIIKEFFQMIGSSKKHKRGIHPLHAFFTSIGGCIGIGNIVAVCTAIQIGGPGALIWMWIAAFLGMAIKYSEVYLGLTHRVPNKSGSFDGGPMFYLQKAFNSKYIPAIICIFLAIYGTEIYMFNVITESISSNWNIDKLVVIAVLIPLILLVGKGGVSRVGKVCSAIIPLFLGIYMFMGSVVVIANYHNIIPILKQIISSAFTGHAAVGAFAGSSLIVTMSRGVSIGCYTGDIGIGYAAIVHAETYAKNSEQQARLAIFGIFLDTFIVCSTTTFIILATGVWYQDIPASHQIQAALSMYFPYMNVFMPIFIFLLGYSTIIAFFCVGAKCAKYLSEKYGPTLYYIYACISFIIFSYVEQNNVYTLMLLCGATLLIINLIGIFKLRNKLKY